MSSLVRNSLRFMTSELSSIYPPDIMVGTVLGIVNDKSSNFYTLKVKTATNFASVFYVYIIEDLQKEERAELKEKIIKNQ